MPIPPACDCGHHFEVPAASAGPPATCPACGRDVPGPESGPPKPRVRRWAVLLGVGGAGLLLAALLLSAVRSARGEARRLQCANNLRLIALALRNYHEFFGCLPPAAIVDKDGRPLLSWRVLILASLVSTDLPDEFRRDEPWDSPHNRALMAKMPPIFACPSDPDVGPGSGMTPYQVVVGPDTAFSPDFRPVRVDDVADGTSNTLLVVESARPVLWTKPDDVRSDDPAPLLGLGSRHPGGFNAVFGDGSVRFLKNTIKPATLRALLTRAGAEAVSADEY